MKYSFVQISMIILIISCLCFIVPANASENTDMQLRVANVKKSTVKIFTNFSTGSGFVITKDGLIATCFHVICQIEPLPDNKLDYHFAGQIDVQLPDGTMCSATVHKKCLDNPFDAVLRDYCILQVNAKNLVPLKLGKFSDAQEGASIYICGYPMGISQSVITRGMLSTKFHFRNSESAWLDVTTNSGNSGGPVLLVGEKPEDDKVIGIVDFQLNPYSTAANNIIKHNESASKTGNAVIMGIDFTEFSSFVSTAIAESTHGVGGCVAIDYLGATLMKIK